MAKNKSSLTSRLAIIPARGGSKRVPRKNIRDFCGSPIIRYSIQAAQESEIFHRIHVSTEDDEIARITETLGVRCDFMRPRSLADDYTPIVPVLKYVVDGYKKRGIVFDEIWLLMPCSPFITGKILKDASVVFKSYNKEKVLVSVCEYPVPIEWSFRCNAKTNELEPVYPGMFAKRSQDIEKAYHDTGSFMAFPSAYFDGDDIQGSDKGLIGYEVPRFASIDIDTESDWKLAEGLYKSKA